MQMLSFIKLFKLDRVAPIFPIAKFQIYLLYYYIVSCHETHLDSNSVVNQLGSGNISSYIPTRVTIQKFLFTTLALTFLGDQYYKS